LGTIPEGGHQQISDLQFCIKIKTFIKALSKPGHITRTIEMKVKQYHNHSQISTKIA
jgi:hypothetical protein